MRPTAKARKQARILIVDDEEQVRRLLSRLLERNGYSCETAQDADRGEVRSWARNTSTFC